MAEAMKNIRAELGSDAVILNSKEVLTGGFLGFFKKRSIEVIAATDQKTTKQQSPKTLQKQNHNIVQTKTNTSEAVQKPSNELIKELNELKTMMKSMTTGASESASIYPEPIQKIHQLMKDQEIDGYLQNAIINSLLEKWYVEGANASIDTVHTCLSSQGK